MNARVTRWLLLGSGLLLLGVTLSLARDQQSLWLLAAGDLMAAIELIAFGLMLERYGR